MIFSLLLRVFFMTIIGYLLQFPNYLVVKNKVGEKRKKIERTFLSDRCNYSLFPITPRLPDVSVQPFNF